MFTKSNKNQKSIFKDKKRALGMFCLPLESWEHLRQMQCSWNDPAAAFFFLFYLGSAITPALLQYKENTIITIFIWLQSEKISDLSHQLFRCAKDPAVWQ